jgi:probable rRNA maturation factor
VPGLGGLARRAVRAALAVAPPLPEAPQAELCVVFADDAAMRDLNRRFRGKDAPTNVLAFAAQETAAGARPATAPAEGVLLLGDVVLAYETVAREAAAAGLPLAHHLSHLVVHGVLHLLGFDHRKARAARTMEMLEIAALARLGVGNPYAAAAQRHAPEPQATPA